MLGRPAPLRPAAKVIRPDDLVEKTVSPEDLVEQHFDVVNLARIQMQIQRPIRSQHTPDLAQTGSQELDVFLKGVAKGVLRRRLRAIPTAAEPNSLALIVSGRAQSLVRANVPRVEWRIGIDELHALRRQGLQNRQVVALDDAAARL